MGFRSQDGNFNSFLVKTDEKDYRLEQNVSSYIDYAAKQREADEVVSSTRKYRSFAIIPDIVAIDILTKYHLDIHDPEFMQDPVNLRKLKSVIMSDYPLLLTSNLKKV